MSALICTFKHNRPFISQMLALLSNRLHPFFNKDGLNRGLINVKTLNIFKKSKPVSTQFK